VIGAILGIGYTASVALAVVPMLYLSEARGWPNRPSFAVYVLLAALGPISAVPIAMFCLWLLGRFTVAGLREAWRIARPHKGDGDLPRAKAVRR
jgi:hypothetical protein